MRKILRNEVRRYFKELMKTNLPDFKPYKSPNPYDLPIGGRAYKFMQNHTMYFFIIIYFPDRYWDSFNIEISWSDIDMLPEDKYRIFVLNPYAIDLKNIKKGIIALANFWPPRKNRKEWWVSPTTGVFDMKSANLERQKFGYKQDDQPVELALLNVKSIVYYAFYKLIEYAIDFFNKVAWSLEYRPPFKIAAGGKITVQRNEIKQIKTEQKKK